MTTAAETRGVKPWTTRSTRRWRRSFRSVPWTPWRRCSLRSGRASGAASRGQFFPVGEDIRRIVVDWVTYLRQEKLWGLDDPLFPATKIVVGDNQHFEASGLDRKHWSSAGPIRTIFKDAFAAAGLPYFNPHSFRKTLALLGGQICNSPEEYKAWSQNLGHENVLTTFSNYGDVAGHRQAEIIRALGMS